MDANFLTNIKTQISTIYKQELYTRQSRVHSKDGKLVSIWKLIYLIHHVIKLKRKNNNNKKQHMSIWINAEK